MDGVVKTLEPKYTGLTMSYIQRFGILDDWDAADIYHFSCENVR